jgi:hypothetical protein
MATVHIQQRLPSYDFVIRTRWSRADAAARLDELFRGGANSAPSLDGSFDGGAFTVLPMKLAHGSSPPAIGGYIVPNQSGGTDVVVRVGTISSKFALVAAAIIPAGIGAIAGMRAGFVWQSLAIAPLVALFGPLLLALPVLIEGQRVQDKLMSKLRGDESSRKENGA